VSRRNTGRHEVLRYEDMANLLRERGYTVLEPGACIRGLNVRRTYEAAFLQADDREAVLRDMANELAHFLLSTGVGSISEGPSDIDGVSELCWTIETVVREDKSDEVGRSPARHPIGQRRALPRGDAGS